MAQYRKKPVVIEAMCFEAGVAPADLHAFFGSFKDISVNHLERALYIHTLEGIMRADEGDWIIKGVKGEFYPCKPDIFEATYERACKETR